jgi:hypothetical protein
MRVEVNIVSGPTVTVSGTVQYVVQATCAPYNVLISEVGIQGPPGVGVPPGGGVGTVLTKLSATDYDTGWVAAPGGGGGAVWGAITGTLSDQIDLQSALDARATAAQGALAETALQPGDPIPWGDVVSAPAFAPIATSGSASDLSSGTIPAARFDDGSHGARGGGSLHATATTTQSGFLSAADKSKLDSIEPGATANATDAALRDRATHTGTQPASTITGLAAIATSGAWSDLTGRPTTFPPQAHQHVAADISDSTAAGRAILTSADAAAQTALLDTFTASAKGLAPASGGGTTNFLRADGVWAAPPAGGGGGVSDGDKGDITVSGSGTVWTIDAGAVTLSKLADVPTDSFLGRDSAGTGAPEVLTPAQARAILNVADGATANASDAALRDRATHTGTQPASTITGLAAVATSGSASDLTTGTLPAARFTDTSHGNRGGGALHAEATTSVAGFMSAADKTKLDGVANGANNYSHPNHTGDVTSVGDGATTIAAGAVTNAKLAGMATGTIKGRASAGTGDPEDLTGAQATALLDTFTSSLKGLVPASGGGTTNFLRADGTWASPPGGGGGISWSDPVDANIVPDADGTRNLGSSANRFAAAHVDAIDLNGVTLDGATDLTVPGADRILFYDQSASGMAWLEVGSGLSLSGTTLSATGGVAALGNWDYWSEDWFGSNNVGGSAVFVGAAVSGGTNTAAIPSAAVFGYNQNGVFLRSGTTENGGYRYQTSSPTGMYFGVVPYKFRCSFLWRTAFTGRTVRMGFLDTESSADATDGAYFEAIGDALVAKTASNSIRTTAGSLNLILDTPYVFDIESNAAGTEVRFRVYQGAGTSTVFDVTITSNIPATSAQGFGAGIVATEASTTDVEIGILYMLGIGTVAGFNRARG